jgi:hypothetical protein
LVDPVRPPQTTSVHNKETSNVLLRTDGLPERFGGPKGKKYKNYKQLRRTLLHNSHKGNSLEEQKKY